MTPSYIDRIARLGASQPMLAWLHAQSHPSLAAAWAVCPRADWMLWLAGRLAGPPGSDSRRPLVLAACACARTALPLYEERFPGDIRPRRAIEAAEAWARGEVDLDAVREAARGARAAAAFAVAAFAALAASAAATVAAVAANAAVAAAAAADAAAATYAARAHALAEMADIIREHYPTPPSLENA